MWIFKECDILDLLDFSFCQIKFNLFTKNDKLRPQELHIQNNRLTCLPAHLSKLHRIEFLDCSHNLLTDIRSISSMASLRILNVSANASLVQLPMELSTCGALVDIVCDQHTIQDPPLHVLELGTAAIMQHLMGNVEAWRDCEAPKRVQVELAEEAVEVEQDVQVCFFTNLTRKTLYKYIFWQS